MHKPTQSFFRIATTLFTLTFFTFALTSHAQMSDWPQANANELNNSYVGGKFKKIPKKPTWSYTFKNTNVRLNKTIVASNKFVYFTAKSNKSRFSKIIAINLNTGKQEFITTVYGKISDPILHKNKLLLVDEQSNIHTLDPATGETLSKTKIKDHSVTSYKIYPINNLLIFKISQGIIALDDQNYQLKWTAKHNLNYCHDDILGNDDLIVFCKMRSVNPTTGTPIQTPFTNNHASHPILTTDKALIFSLDDAIIAYDTETKQRLWRTFIHDQACAIASGNGIIAVSCAKQIVTLDADTGQILRTKKNLYTKYNQNIALTDTHFFETRSSRTTAYSVSSLKKTWSYHEYGDFILSNGYLIIIHDDKKAIDAFKLPVAKPRKRPRRK